MSFRDPIVDAALKQIIKPEELPRAMSAAQARSSVFSMMGGFCGRSGASLSGARNLRRNFYLVDSYCSSGPWSLCGSAG